MRILFLCSDDVSAPVRIKPLLEALQAAGSIEGFACVNRDMQITARAGATSAFEFAIVHRNPSRRQVDWLRRSAVPFLYDIDDLLLQEPVRSAWTRAGRQQNAIRWCLAKALSITAPSRRLLATLQQRLGCPFEERAIYLPNAGLHVPTLRKTGRPRILWVSSHRHLYAEMCEIARGLAAAATALETEVVLIGPFPTEIRAAIPKHRHVAWLAPHDYARFLAEQTFIAAAPLPIRLEGEEQEFIDCKSDIKAAQFGSAGIPGLYTAAPPYTESDLPCSLVEQNTAAAWRDGMIGLAQSVLEDAADLPANPAIAARHPQRISLGLLGAIMRVPAAKRSPIAFRAIATPAVLRRVEQRIRLLRVRLLG